MVTEFDDSARIAFEDEHHTTTDLRSGESHIHDTCKQGKNAELREGSAGAGAQIRRRGHPQIRYSLKT